MRFKFKNWSVKLIVTIVLCSLFGIFADSANARNVPGSASAVVGPLSETASASLINGIHDGLLKVRGDDRVPQTDIVARLDLVSQGAIGNDGSLAFQGGNAGFLNEDGFGVLFNLEYRNVDNSDIDADLLDGSALLLYRPQANLLLFGGVIGEYLDGDTPFNVGTIEAEGVGAAAGFDARINDNTSIIGALGYLFLDYDVTRTAGAIRGSFDATRLMADLQTNTVRQQNGVIYTYNFGARYIHQDNDSYTESGGLFVGSTSHTTFSALAGMRARFISAGVDPFLETQIRYDLVDDSNLPVGVADLSSTDFNARFGAGIAHETGNSLFEFGVGVHTTEDGYDGFDGRLRIVKRF